MKSILWYINRASSGQFTVFVTFHQRTSHQLIDVPKKMQSSTIRSDRIGIVHGGNRANFPGENSRFNNANGRGRGGICDFTSRIDHLQLRFGFSDLPVFGENRGKLPPLRAARNFPSIIVRPLFRPLFTLGELFRVKSLFVIGIYILTIFSDAYFNQRGVIGVPKVEPRKDTVEINLLELRSWTNLNQIGVDFNWIRQRQWRSNCRFELKNNFI